MKNAASTLGWVALGLLLLASFVVDVENVSQGGAIDLRNRITGIRLLVHQIDPYHYKWQEPEPPEYCDPYNNPLLPVSKTTATPALLLLHLPLAVLPYRIAQFLWFLLQWALLLGTAWLWLRRCPNSFSRWLTALFFIGFTYTSAWRLHAERGQSYVLLLFLFACWLVVTLDAKTSHRFLAGLLAGFLITLRPPFALLLPFLVRHRRDQLAGAIVGLLLGFGLPLLWDADCWSDYFSAMQSHSAFYLTDNNPHYEQTYPPMIEGIPTDNILAYYVPIPYADFSIHALLKYLGWEIHLVELMPPHLLIAIPFILWLWFSRKQSTEALLPGVVAWLFLVDLFLPAYRNSYNDVLILNFVALGFLASTRISRATWLCLLALPLGWSIYALSPNQPWLINLPSFLFAFSTVLFLFLFNNRAITHKMDVPC